MPNKMDLLVAKGSAYGSNSYSIKVDIINRDSTSIPLSGLRVESFGWFKEADKSKLKTTIVSNGTLKQWSILGSFMGQTGIVTLDMFNTSYRVYHNTIDPTKTFPQLSLNVPVGNAAIGPISYTNHTATYFDIILPDAAPRLGYSVSWNIPAYTEDSTNGNVQDLLSPVVNFISNDVSSLVTRQKDTSIQIYWTGSTQVIPVGYSLTDLEIIIEGDFTGLSSLSNWYTQLPDTKSSISTVAIYQSGSLVTEYLDSTNIDPNTGVEPSTTGMMEITSSLYTYIDSSAPNPTASLASDRNLLSVGTLGTATRRSLIKFNTSLVPTNKVVSRAILRLNVKSDASAGSGSFTIGQLSEEWNDTQANWNTRVNGINWTTPGGTVVREITSTLNYGPTKWIDIDVTNIVESWRNTGDNFGFLIKSNTPNVYMYSNAYSNEPKLIVYSSNTIATPTSSILRIVSPSDGNVYSNSTSLTITVAASATINSVSAYCTVDNVRSYIGNMTNSGNWFYTSAISAFMPAGKIGWIQCVGTDGTTTYSSNKVSVKTNSLPTITFLNPTAILSAGSQYIVSARVYDPEGYNSCQVDIKYNSTTFYSGTSDSNGFLSFLWPSNEGSYNLSVKIIDGLYTSESITTTATINLARYNGSFNIPYSNAIKGGSQLVPTTKVIPQTFNYTGSFTLTGFSINKRYSLFYNGTEVETLTDTGSTLTASKTGLYSVGMVVTVAGTSIELFDTPVYIRNSIIDFSVNGGNVCNDGLTISGKVIDSDKGLSVIDSSFNIGAYQNNTLLDYISYDSYGNFNQPLNPAIGLGVITLKVIDNYGNVTGSLTKDIGRIYDTSTVGVLSIIPSDPNSVVYGNGQMYGISGCKPIILSAVTNFGNFTDAIHYTFIIRDKNDNILSVQSSDTQDYISYTPTPRSFVDISVSVTTKGGCVFGNNKGVYDHFKTTVILNTPTIPSCYCSSETFTVVADIDSIAIHSDKFVDYGLTYTQFVSGAFDDVIKKTETVTPTGRYVWSFDQTGVVGTISAAVYVDDNTGGIIKRGMSKVNFKQITQSPVIQLTSPVAGIHYSVNDQIHFNVAATTGTLKSVKYYVNDILVGQSSDGSAFDYIWSDYKDPTKTYTVKAVGVSPDNCVSNVVSQTLNIGSGPIVNIVDKPVSGKLYGPAGTWTITATVDSNVQLSAVVLKFSGIGGTADIPMNKTGDKWIQTMSLSSGFAGTFIVSAVDINNTTGLDFVNIIESTAPSIDLIVDKHSYQLGDTIYTSAVLNSTSNISKVQIANGKFIKDIPFTGLTNTFSLPAYELGLGDTVLVGIVYNTDGVASTDTELVNVSFSGIDSQPIIKNISNDPIDKVSKNGVTSVFEIYDNINAIDTYSINSNNIPFNVLNTNKISQNKWEVTVLVNGTGYIEISAVNKIGRSTVYRFNNYIVSCSPGDRKINLTNYLPEYLREDWQGNDSETYQFLGTFEKYLNSLYGSLENGCSISTLEKISRLQKLHDIDKIDAHLIPNYANLVGYKTDVNGDEFGTFGYFGDTTYTDSQAEYAQKSLRFVIRNLPNWYSIKTTRNSLKIMLLSYGIIGDVIEYYTTDYKDDWYHNKVSEGQYVADGIPINAYPTPHMSIGIDLSQTKNSDIYGENKLKNVVNSMESIRPANVVFEGISGYLNDVMLPGVNIAMAFTMSKSITVDISNQINNH